MKNINIDGKEYTLEYTIGASLYDECVVSVMKLLSSYAYAESDELKGNTKAIVDEQLTIMGGIPKVALNCFYAGLLEHHGTGEYAGENSDGSVSSIVVARGLIGKYLKESKENGTGGTFMDVFNMCVECMGDDDFLTLIGVDDMISTMTPQKKSTKRGRPKKEIIEA